MNWWLCFYGKVMSIIILLLIILNSSQCEWFSSLSHMEDLVDDELNLLSSLKHYIQSQEVKLENLKRISEQFQQHIGGEKVLDYLNHPINQFHLVKRLAFQWPHVDALISESSRSSTEFLETISSKLKYFPDKSDLQGSAQALMRLQDTYKLETRDLMKGIVKDFKANQTLSPEDCYDIGRTAYTTNDYYHCMIWMKELSLIDEGSYVSFTRFDVLDHLSYCLAQMGNIEEAYNVSVEMILLKPNDERTRNNFKEYSQYMSEGSTPPTTYEPLSGMNPRNLKKYEELCRNENITIPPHVTKQLKCYHWTNHNHPLLILQPAKVEELWYSPQLLQFYDVVSDNEIKRIKALSKPLLHRSTVNNPATGKLEHARYRVAKSAWLDDDFLVVGKISQRINALTGLSMTTSEQLQVANYGVGGQYEPHFDYFGPKVQVDPSEGNRIATFLIYLSDVEQGGDTVFLQPGIPVHPMKGSAAFWFNLYPSGEPDERTRHAACPVLTGVKWVANKWIHEVGQEFKGRQCELDQNADNIFLK